MSNHYIEETAKKLSKMIVGERQWFWFCPTLDVEQARLLLSPLRKDPGMEKLLEEANRIPVSLGAKMFVGLVFRTEHEGLRFGCLGLSQDALSSLAQWSIHHAPRLPALCRLKNCSFIDTDAKGVVQNVIQNPSFWKDLPDPKPSGYTAKSLETLRKMVPDEEAWFWMSSQSALNTPILIVMPIHKDPDGVLLSKRISHLAGTGPIWSGVLSFLRSDLLVFTSSSSLQVGMKIIQSLLQDPRMAILKGAKLLRVDKGGFVEAKIVPIAQNLSLHSHFLSILSKDCPLLFWFTESDRNAQPHLLLERNGSNLKERALAIQGKGESIRGKLSVSAKGLVFQSKKKMDNFLPVLEQWIEAHTDHCPALKRLQGAQYRFRGPDG